MALIKCDKCHDWHRLDEPCEPVFEVYFEDYLGEKPKIIHAYNHEDAALKFAEYYDSRHDHCLIYESIDVKVVDGAGVAKFFGVSAEPYINYTSMEIEGD